MEVICARAQEISNSKSRKGLRYNQALARQLEAHPDLAVNMKGPNISGACWILRNWRIARDYLAELSPARLIELNPHSLRVSIERDLKRKAGGPLFVKPKKARLRAEVAALQEENDDLRHALRQSERRQSERFNIVKDDACYVVEVMVGDMKDMAPDKRHKQIKELIKELQQYLRNNPLPKKSAASTSAKINLTAKAAGKVGAITTDGPQ